MKVRVLGCSGGIGGRHLRTTSFLLDQDILIDAGTGVEELSLAELKAIDHVFLTHSHLDHIASLPMLVDTVGEMRSQPITVHALPDTIAVLKAHIFNWLVWPDFTEIPSQAAPFMQFREIEPGATYLMNGRRINVLPANHTVPAVGYQLDSGRGSIVYTGDTGVNDALWPIVNAIKNLRVLIIETAFPNAQRDLAEMSRHLCPDTLAAELSNLRLPADVYITHLKPGHIEDTMAEIESLGGAHQPSMLQNCQVFEF